MSIRRILALCTICLFVTSVVMAQGKCSAQTIKGMYSATCSGFLAAGPGAFLPYAGQGTITTDVVDRLAAIAGGAQMSIAGQQQFGPVFAGPGDVVVNPDCTGTLVYNRGVMVNGQSVQLDINFNVLDDGKEIRGFITDPGYIVSCNLRLMSRNAELAPASQVNSAAPARPTRPLAVRGSRTAGRPCRTAEPAHASPAWRTVAMARIRPDHDVRP